MTINVKETLTRLIEDSEQLRQKLLTEYNDSQEMGLLAHVERVNNIILEAVSSLTFIQNTETTDTYGKEVAALNAAFAEFTEASKQEPTAEGLAAVEAHLLTQNESLAKELVEANEKLEKLSEANHTLSRTVDKLRAENAEAAQVNDKLTSENLELRKGKYA